jgi:adenine deaminase
MPVAGLMSDRRSDWVSDKLMQIHKTAHLALGVSKDVDPVMTLCFMSLPVIGNQTDGYRII